MRFVALLRAINVGAANRLSMNDLKEVIAEAGGSDVETLGNSGNAILDAEGPRSEVNAALERALAARMRKPMPVVLRTRPQWRKIVAADPFPRKPPASARLAVTFLREPAKAPLPAVPNLDVVHRTPSEIYSVWRIANGRPPAFTRHEKALGVASTTRFWSVVGEIAERL